jgi:ferric-dicitrate binding protein FerR (iron transport regulator)
MSAEGLEELDRLVSRMIDRQLSESDAARLDALLAESPEAVQRYHELLDNHEALSAIYAGDVYESSLDPAELPAHGDPTPASRLASSMRRRALVLCVVTAAILAAMLLRPGRNVQIATLTEVKGSVLWTGDGGEVIRDLKAGRQLEGGTLECLYADSWCKIDFRDGTAITVSGRSVLTISRGRQKEVSLVEGSLSANVAPQPSDRPLLIHTSTANLEVLGTQFDLVAEPSSMDLSVAEGCVRVTRLMDGSVADVPAEHQIRASADVHQEFSVQPRSASVATWQSNLPEGAIHGQWLPEMGGRFSGLRATPLLRQDDEGKPIVFFLAAGSVSRQPAVSLLPGTVLRIHGKTDTPPTLSIGITAQHATGGFAGKYVLTKRLEASSREGGLFDLEVSVADFAPDDANFPKSPIGLEICDWWCSTKSADAGLSILKVELVPPPQQP